MNTPTDTKRNSVESTALFAALSSRLEHALKRYIEKQNDGDAISTASTRASYDAWREAISLVKHYLLANASNMSKFDAVLGGISEALPPVTPQQQTTTAGIPPKPATGQAQQPQVDPKIVQELIAAKNEQQVQMALQKLQAAQAAQQQKPATPGQPAV